jgi:hypothetical protein
MRRVSMATRDELVVAIAERYGRSRRGERGRILDEFVTLLAAGAPGLPLSVPTGTVAAAGKAGLVGRASRYVGARDAAGRYRDPRRPAGWADESDGHGWPSKCHAGPDACGWADLRGRSNPYCAGDRSTVTGPGSHGVHLSPVGPPVAPVDPVGVLMAPSIGATCAAVGCEGACQ